MCKLLRCKEIREFDGELCKLRVSRPNLYPCESQAMKLPQLHLRDAFWLVLMA